MSTTPLPVGTELRPTRSTHPAADIPGFFAAVEKAMALHIKTTEVPHSLEPILARDFPKERLANVDQPFDVITGKVISAQLAPTSNTSDRIGWKPKLRERYKHPTQAGYNLATYAWWENVAVGFEVWGKSNGRADLLATWFHRFLIRYAHVLDFFRARGIDHFTFVERKEDEVQLREGQELYKRMLVYQFRLETIDAVLEKQLTDIDIRVATGGETVTLVLPRP